MTLKRIFKHKAETWTEEQVQFLKDNYLKIPVKQIAKILRLNSSTPVFWRMKRYGLKLTPEVKEQRFLDSQFKKGSVPVNKGKKQSEYVLDPEAFKRSVETRFKKGNLPANTLYDGAIRIRHESDKRGGRAYKYIRLALGKWKELHQYNWEKTHGPIPKGFVVRFKDGDSLNPDPSNLELVERLEHLERNINYRNSDGFIAGQLSRNDPELRALIKKQPDILQLQRLKIKLNKEIKNAASNT